MRALVGSAPVQGPHLGVPRDNIEVEPYSCAHFLKILRRSTDLLTDDPVREEFFSVERLELYASQLAGNLKISSNNVRQRYLLPDLKKIARELLSSYLLLTEDSPDNDSLSPAAVWFVDNFHIVEEQIREIKQDLPKSYYKELPKLSSGELIGCPRVYAIALAIIAHTDCRLDTDTLKRFLKSYQNTAPLTLGELWAMAITLRIALVEQLKPLILRVVTSKKQRADADQFADELLKLAMDPDAGPGNSQSRVQNPVVKKFIAGLGSPEHFNRAFIVQLTQRLRDQDPDLVSAFDWLENQLDQFHHTNIQSIIQLEHTRQATAQVTVGNIITSLRLLSAIDWREFIENVNLIDPILNKDPAISYAKMDFQTRDCYRHVVERLAKGSEYTEIQVAESALKSAQEKISPKEPHVGNDSRDLHVGFYLIGDGALDFEEKIGYAPKLRERVKRSALRHPTLVYLGSLCAFTLAFLFPVFLYFREMGGSTTLALCFLLIALLPASEFALGVLNHIVTMLLKPERLPRFDTSKGIPVDATTMVVIPSLLKDANTIKYLLGKLQIHYLSNHDPHIYFALLGDFVDADQEHLLEDSILLKQAQDGIDELNAQYGDKTGPHFFLFQRNRLFNPCEGKWMGWERKRGKIREFNGLLRGATGTSFKTPSLQSEQLQKVRYVITLDSDTVLPRGTAAELIGTALHPLNAPELDKEKQRVISGYGILQPRMSVGLVSASRTRFAHLFSSARGLDPYSTAFSDVYQDLFGEGSYTGKGLYVVDAFEAALGKRTPENTVLSHDLFEGSFARSALVSDVELFDDYPSDYEDYAKRNHRWIRGDWQIAPWLFRKVPTSDSKSTRNQLPLIAKWKILDNLRRSAVPQALILWLWLGWLCLPGAPLFWTLLLVVLFAFPIYVTGSRNILYGRHGVSWRTHVSYRWSESLTQTQQILVMIAFMPNQAWNHTDAIARVIYRKLFSHQKYLEWTAFADTEQSHGKFAWSTALLGPIFAVFTAGTLLLRGPPALFVAAPFLLAWLTNPILKSWLEKKAKQRIRSLVASEIAAFRLYARRTWHFFETFVTPEENFLAPDNFQEKPSPVVVSHTSPTNIGIQLLSLSSAYDFGYIGRLEFVEHSERIFTTLAKLERLQGHFLNWYNTRTLEPLWPKYVSTVDSGNLAGHFLAFKRALIGLIESSKPSLPLKEGLVDTLFILQEEIQRIEKSVPASQNENRDLFHNTIASTVNLLVSSSWATTSECGDTLIEVESSLAKSQLTLNQISAVMGADACSEIRIWMSAATNLTGQLKRDISPNSLTEALKIRQSIESMISHCDDFFMAMDFKFLFDDQRKLFAIGYNVADHRVDNSYYDLLASESRLTSLVAIAKGDVPQEHWFRLGRHLTEVKGGRALISWTGTMFEYLMPLLVTRSFSETLLNQTYRSIVGRQIQYGRQKGVPWGVSESEYNMRDLRFMFQYRAFGVPGLGLKRGLSDDLVISPYSTMLAAVVDPVAAFANLKSLERMGILSRYGFYESIDYTPERLKDGESYFVLQAFMAHHQGMSLVSMNNLLNENVMQKRFHSEPLIQASQLLLQERIPLSAPIYRPRAEEVHSGRASVSTYLNPRIYSDVNLSIPRIQLMSNGIYSVMITTAGSGYSICGDTAINRWREDGTRDNWGQFFYVRDCTTSLVWSPGFLPTGIQPKKYEVTFVEDRVEFWREDGKITTTTEVIVSSEDNAEIRRISIINNSEENREFEVTSFLEVVLAPLRDDIAHPAFSNLFVQTEFVPAEGALLAKRRPKSGDDTETGTDMWAFHVLVVEGEIEGPVQYETDRAAFLGRNRDSSDPIVMSEARDLSNTVGDVLDPSFSLRQKVNIPAGKTARVSFSTGVSSSREEVLRLVDKYHDIHIFDREAELAWTASRIQLRHLNIVDNQPHTFQRLASRVIYSDPLLRTRAETIAKNSRTQSSLWAYGISGDFPIVLVEINSERDMPMVRELLHGHEYLRLKGLKIDLVLLNKRASSYLQAVEDELNREIRMVGSQGLLDKPGGIFIRREELMQPEDVILLKTISRVVLDSEKGTLKEQLRHHPSQNASSPKVPDKLIDRLSDKFADKFIPAILRRSYPEFDPKIPDLIFFNGLGGFTKDGREYVIVLKEGAKTPAPWINVISNSLDFGFLISESGGGYTWSLNSQENRLTPWSNDAVTDPPGEMIYIRDDESGEYWTPTPAPMREKGTYLVRHGQGYSQFEYDSHGISSVLKVFVPLDANVKISVLRVKNRGTRKRSLSIISYVEWVLGQNRAVTAPNTVTSVVVSQDATNGTLLARNSYNNEFRERIAFSHISGKIDSFTCDRKEFLGRNSKPSSPQGLGKKYFSNRSGAALDPCAALQSKVDLAPGEECEIFILLGQGKDEFEAKNLVLKYSNAQVRDDAFKAVVSYWDEALGAITIKTSDPAMDLMVNRWLLYQTLSCRVWGRSAFYQSGGAFGFRDQLQDVMALVYAKPQIAREQILLSARHQFVEGDVLHWWHPPSGRGVRTHFSDDLVFLPFVTSFYVGVTGDRSILKEIIPFIEAPALNPEAESSYLLPTISQQAGTLSEHCVRALDRSLKKGAHGLPLMGCGDWNDGMNRIGAGGKGESVWLAWFLYRALKDFKGLLSETDQPRARLYENHMEKLKSSIQENAWDGNWYRRAFFDDGTPLGSVINKECKIDSIAQSWSVLSGSLHEPSVGNQSDEIEKTRAVTAMGSVDELLVDRHAKLIMLFTPPFDKGGSNPGYIKGYLPGVRENGGQYTHAAAWTVIAFASLGDKERSLPLFQLLNPISHSSTDGEIETYKVEPFVVAGDIYSVAPHIGRGGWTWYTGSASWMYRAALESLLGFQLKGDRLQVNPCLPKSFGEFQISYKRGATRFNIHAKQSEQPANRTVEMDGVKLVSNEIVLIEDGKTHEIRVSF